MRTRSTFVTAVLALALAAPGFTQSPLTVDDVVQMLDAKLPESVVLAKIRSSAATFDLSTEDLVRLKEAGATEGVMVAMMTPPAAAPSPAGEVRAQDEGDAEQERQFPEVGVYYKKAGEWIEMLPEVVNWKTGGVLKNVASVGVVKKDINGHLPGPHSRNSVASPLEFVVHTPEGVAITEYQLLRLRDNPDKGYREFRTITGGVFNSKSGAMRDMVPFEGKRVGKGLYSVVLPGNIGAGEYGFIHLGSSGGSGGLSSLSMGKMYTFRFLE